MKKILIIILVSGRKIERDITSEKGFPLGAPANDVHYATMCATIAANGYTDPDKTSDSQYSHIAPSQIASVDVKFVKP
jgi:hypothetical protein